MKKLTFLLGLIALAGCTTVPQSRTGTDWKLGVQAWTFRNGTFFEAVDKTAAVGVHYIEAYPGQAVGGGIPGGMGTGLDADARQKILAKLKDSGVTLINFGVASAGDEAGWHKLFEFAKDMGIQTIVAEPPPEQLPMIDKLCKTYRINLAIHDHPKPSRYWNPDTVLAAIKGRSRYIGVCADVGHWVRSGLDPVACLKKLHGHIISLHFKDLSAKDRAAHDVPWGTGVSNVPDMLAELKHQGFRGVFSIEYEHNTPELLANVRRCVQYFEQNAPLTERELRSGKAVIPGMTPDINQVSANITTAKADLWPTEPHDPLTSHPDSSSWADLFAPDLSNAVNRDGQWSWKDGVLSAKDKDIEIWTKDEHENFIIDLEFNMEPGANSGVFVYNTDMKNWVPNTVEIQVLDDPAPKWAKCAPTWKCGGIFGHSAPMKTAVKPAGEWNRMTIQCEGPRISVLLNGELVTNINMKDWKSGKKNPDGSSIPGWLPRPLAEMATKGHIGLQGAHGGIPTHFRNLKIKSLD